jgi:pilus assembly protein CpaE
LTPNVLLVGSNDRQLDELLRAGGLKPTSIPLADLAALAHPSAPQPDVIVLDLRETSQLPPSLALVKRQHPATAVVIVAPVLDPILVLDAMRAGANECVTDPVTERDLQAALDRVLAQRKAPAAGEVFAFIGAKGGVGTTTLAVNIATELARLAAAEGTLLVDLHLSYGDAALLLSAEPRFSILDALENTHRLDEAFFRGLVVRTKAGPDLLASSERGMTAPVDAHRIRTLIEFAARQYRYTVLDVPRSATDALDALETASTIIIVANQDLATVRSASRMSGLLRQRYGKEKVRVVVSRFDSKAEITHDDIERTIGLPVHHMFPSDYRLALQALNKGRPLSLDNHNRLAGSFAAFARDLSGVGDRPPERTRSLFGRMTGRK